FDLYNMVVSYKRMVLFLEPVLDALELTRFLLGWKMPVYSLLVCVFLNAFFCTIDKGSSEGCCYWFACFMSLLWAGCSLDSTALSSCGTETSAEVRTPRLEEALANLALFRKSVTLNRCTSHVPSVLIDLRKMFHMGPSQASETVCEEQEQSNLLDSTPTPTSLEDLSPGSVEEAEEAEPDDEFKDAIDEDDEGPLGAPEYDTVSENGLISRNEPIRSKVSKLTEKLRKRYPTTTTGNCSSCGAVFSVLKKRVRLFFFAVYWNWFSHNVSVRQRNCSNCGNSFCSRCCSYKVPRSYMGATAPEAQRETVFVCAACSSSLTKP
ncbi:unnamed protein product, partial [Tetraodon nigroviridis]